MEATAVAIESTMTASGAILPPGWIGPVTAAAIAGGILLYLHFNIEAKLLRTLKVLKNINELNSQDKKFISSEGDTICEKETLDDLIKQANMYTHRYAEAGYERVKWAIFFFAVIVMLAVIIIMEVIADAEKWVALAAMIFASVLFVLHLFMEIAGNKRAKKKWEQIASRKAKELEEKLK